MCTVQVMLFADVMRSPDRLRSSGGVCRRLFTNDSSSTSPANADPSVFLKTMEAQLRHRDTTKWNFDFQREVPLPGRYQWEAVGGSTQTSQRAVAENSEENTDEEVVYIEKVERTQSSIPTCKAQKCCAGVATQAKITDFLNKRKRHQPQDTIPSKKLRRLESRTSFFSTQKKA